MGRDPASVSVLAVSKAVSVERLSLALAAGITQLGENRVQEAEAKAPLLSGVQWHLVGHLQSNKAARAIALFEQIHSVDSVGLAQRLDRLQAATGDAGRPAVYLQVNVDDDSGKSGFAPSRLGDELGQLAELASLELRGLMTVGRLTARAEEARSTFRRLRELAERLRAGEPRLGGGLSMGMSDDFEVAVEEGATVVRVGRAIFGDRPAD
ncbi:YggS family pyridoxal phosphate-dependent enzyme [soil metagenome]